MYQSLILQTDSACVIYSVYSSYVSSLQVLSGALRVFLLCLVSLDLRGTEAQQQVDQNALDQIISLIQEK